MLLGVAAVGALAADFSGDPAQELIHRLPGVDKSALDAHGERAGMAMVLTVAAGLIGASGYAVIRAAPVSRTVVGVTAAAALAAFVALAWTGLAGGQIRHGEVRPAVDPTPPIRRMNIQPGGPAEAPPKPRGTAIRPDAPP